MITGLLAPAYAHDIAGVVVSTHNTDVWDDPSVANLAGVVYGEGRIIDEVPLGLGLGLALTLALTLTLTLTLTLPLNR